MNEKLFTCNEWFMKHFINNTLLKNSIKTIDPSLVSYELINILKVFFDDILIKVWEFDD